MNAGMTDMLMTMSKFLVVGMPLQKVVQASTDTPAKVIKRPELGHLSVGAEADVAVLRVLDGTFGYADGARGTLTGNRRLACEMTLRAGRVVWDWNARSGTDYRQLPPTYGVRDVDRVIVPPRP
jgi:dihydroorotase